VKKPLNLALLMIFATLFFTRCAHSSALRSSAASSIGPIEVRNIVLSKATKENIELQLGRPDHLLSISDTEEAWIYFVRQEEQNTQRLSLIFSKKENTVTGATWIPEEGSPWGSSITALKNFKDSSFRVVDLGWISKHEYSDNANYIDNLNEISLLVNKTKGSVMAISFGIPTKDVLVKNK